MIFIFQEWTGYCKINPCSLAYPLCMPVWVESDGVSVCRWQDSYFGKIYPVEVSEWYECFHYLENTQLCFHQRGCLYHSVPQENSFWPMVPWPAFREEGRAPWAVEAPPSAASLSKVAPVGAGVWWGMQALDVPCAKIRRVWMIFGIGRLAGWKWWLNSSFNTDPYYEKAAERRCCPMNKTWVYKEQGPF